MKDAISLGALYVLEGTLRRGREWAFFGAIVSLACGASVQAAAQVFLIPLVVVAMSIVVALLTGSTLRHINELIAKVASKGAK